MTTPGNDGMRDDPLTELADIGRRAEEAFSMDPLGRGGRLPNLAAMGVLNLVMETPPEHVDTLADDEGNSIQRITLVHPWKEGKTVYVDRVTPPDATEVSHTILDFSELGKGIFWLQRETGKISRIDGRRERTRFSHLRGNRVADLLKPLVRKQDWYS